LRAKVVGISAIARSRLAANTAYVGGAAERRRVASIRGSALTADAEAAATTAGINILLAGTSHKVEGTLSKAIEVCEAHETLGFVVRNNEELVRRNVTISANTNGVHFYLWNLTLNPSDGINKVLSADRGVVRAVITVDVVVVVAVSKGNQNLLGASATKLELFGSKSHTSGDCSTTAAA